MKVTTPQMFFTTRYSHFCIVFFLSFRFMPPLSLYILRAVTSGKGKTARGGGRGRIKLLGLHSALEDSIVTLHIKALL